MEKWRYNIQLFSKKKNVIFSLESIIKTLYNNYATTDLTQTTFSRDTEMEK